MNEINTTNLESAGEYAIEVMVFRLDDKLYGVAATEVLESVWMPGITPLDGVCDNLAGVVNFHDALVPIVDLGLCMGRKQNRYGIDDVVIFIGTAKHGSMGIIANSIEDVRSISSDLIEDPVSLYDNNPTLNNSCIVGIARAGKDVIALIEPSQLLTDVTAFCEPTDLTTSEIMDTSDDEQLVLNQRAEQLMHSSKTDISVGETPIAIVKLNKERFGIDLHGVRGFADIGKITRIPYTPEHFVGSMNLRGEIVLLADFSNFLNIQSNLESKPNKVLITDINGSSLGMLVHDIEDIINISPTQIKSVPLGADSDLRKYYKGSVTFGQGMISMLDLTEILKSNEMFVNETV
jgi:purine-binding chemotaxis protein CheW